MNLQRWRATTESGWTVLVRLMVVALISTKVPIWLGRDWWLFHVAPMGRYGFWSMLHEARTDLDMLLAAIYLLIVGGGCWSLDHRWASARLEVR